MSTVPTGDDRRPTDLDDVLQALARIDASPQFVANVRARIASSPSPAIGWLRMAVATAALLAAITAAFWLRQPASSDRIGSAAGERAAVRRPGGAAGDIPVIDPPARRIVGTTEPAAVLAPLVTRRRRASPFEKADDHERALAALAPPAALTTDAVTPAALETPAITVARLAELEPLPVTELNAGEPGKGDVR